VFAIETKARTKRPGPNSEKDNEAVFDGRAIHFPDFIDFKALAQAERNGVWLATLLSGALAERVAVCPIVALPGWWVTLTARSQTKVLSGKQIFGFINGQPPTLSPKAIRQISHQLSQRCRDIQF
jgi:hypothetical protein